MLAGQLVRPTGLDRLAAWCRDALANDADAGLLDGLAGWYAGPPLAGPDLQPGSALFPDAGYAVLRPPASADGGPRPEEQGWAWLAVVDYGPHGGSHGHLDKLALYLYGDGIEWQPDPGVVPYASRLRHDVYRSTRAHPAFSVDGAEQAECIGRLLHWDGTSVTVSADDAYPGAQARRHVAVLDAGLPDAGLLDILHLCADRERELALHLRPAVPTTATAHGTTWRTSWGGTLTAVHAASVPSRLELVPAWAPADDPSRPNHWLDWTAIAAEAVFVTLWLPGPDTGAAVSISASDQAVTVHRGEEQITRYDLTAGGQP
jgi:hypothetical protein